jgi:homoserine O-acetyltransferase
MNWSRCRQGQGGVAAALGKITIPVLVVSIDTDRLFPRRLQEEIVELTPSARPLESISSPFWARWLPDRG